MPKFDLWYGDKEDQFILTRSQLQSLYSEGSIDGDRDEFTVDTFEAIKAIGAMKACAYWPRQCNDCFMCGGESVIPPTPYNKRN